MKIYPLLAWSLVLLMSIINSACSQVVVSANDRASVEAEDAASDPANSEQPTQAGRSKQSKPRDSIEFLRVHKDGQQLRALQSAVVTYSNPTLPTSPKITLIGAIHVGQADYYHQLNQLFEQFDVLLFEMVMDPSGGVPDPRSRGVSPVSTIQVGLKDALELSFQLDEIDYKAKNFVHADMTPDEFSRSMQTRNEGVWQMFFRTIGSSVAMQSTNKTGDAELLSAMFSKNRAVALRRALAEQMCQMDGQMAALSGNDGKSTLITERNAKAFEVMDRQIADGKSNVAMFYGAGHLKDMHSRLVKQYQLQPIDVQWLDAWNLLE